MLRPGPAGGNGGARIAASAPGLQQVNRFSVDGLYCVAQSRFFILLRLRAGGLIG
jgi:hypothetical protein